MIIERALCMPMKATKIWLMHVVLSHDFDLSSSPAFVCVCVCVCVCVGIATILLKDSFLWAIFKHRLREVGAQSINGGKPERLDSM